MNEADPQNNIFLVEKLLDRRWKRNKAEYLVKWQGYPDSENTWEPKQNINPRLVEQFDAENGGPLTGPPPKTPKTPKAAARSSTTATPPQRGRPRAPPKQREETQATSTRGRRRRTAGDDATSETNTSTASVDESISSSAAKSESEAPTAKKARFGKEPVKKVEEKTKDVPDSSSQPPKETIPEPSAVDEPIVTEVHIESIMEISKEEPTFSSAPSNVHEQEVQFVDEVKIPTADLTEDAPPINDVIEKQPEVVYEYEQMESETIETDQGSSSLITERHQIIVETPVEPDTTSNQQEERFESVSYVIDDDDDPQVLQIHETSSTVTGNNGALPTQNKGSFR